MVATQPSTVLFLAANPLQVQPLQLGEECRAIESRIRAAKYRDRIRFRSRWAARPDDLLQALNEDTPSVLHFSGHGAGEQGLCFQSEDGSPLNVSADGLGQVVQSAGTSVNVVVLNACFSEIQAQALVSHVPCVIGMSGAIRDEAAVVYAGAFYRALAFGKSVANAHKQGLAALSVHPTSGHARDVEPAEGASCAPLPKLLTRPDTDADCIRIVAETATKTKCELVIKATLHDFNADVIARVTELLREITGDLSLEITDIKEGSVRLTISLSPEAAEKLMRLRADGQLDEICGLTVSAILGSPDQEEAQTSFRVNADAGSENNLKFWHSRTQSVKTIGSPLDAWQGSARHGVSEEHTDLMGTLLGDYRIVEPIDQRSMGEVWMGRHEKLGHRVVVKVLRPELSRHREMVKRFFNEAQAPTSIRNPGIAQVFDFGATSDGRAYIVMEFLEGVSLSTRLKERQLDAVECCRLAHQMANVLQAAHDAGITHRNLNPDNLFLVPDPTVVGGERVKVLDFGIAKLTGGLHASGVQAHADLLMVTPSYMSPEQCRGAGSVDARSDIYSLGCVLFMMVSGRPPFISRSVGGVFGAHLHVSAPDLREFAPNAPSALAVLIAKMLKKTPAARPQTMSAVGHALAALLRELAEAPAQPSMHVPATAAPLYGRAATPLSAAPMESVPATLPDMPPAATTLPVSSPPLAAEAMGQLAWRESGPSTWNDAPSMVERRRSPTPVPGASSGTGATTISSSAGVSNAHLRSGASERRPPFLIGGFIIVVGVVTAVVVALLTRALVSPAQQGVPEDAVPDWNPSTTADSGPITDAATPDAATTIAADQTGGALTANKLEAECRGYQVDKKWNELEKCADELMPLAPTRAAELKRRAGQETKTAPHVAAANAALRGKALQRARDEIALVWAESVELPILKSKYAALESQVITELVASLDQAKTATCAEYEVLLVKERAAQPSRVIAEATRRSMCTPASAPPKCDANALAEVGRAQYSHGYLAEAFASFEAAYACEPSPQLAEKAFIIACNLSDVAKAKSSWRRLPPKMRTRTAAICMRNGISEAMLSEPGQPRREGVNPFKHDR